MPAFIQVALHILEWDMCFLLIDFLLSGIQRPKTYLALQGLEKI